MKKKRIFISAILLLAVCIGSFAQKDTISISDLKKQVLRKKQVINIEQPITNFADTEGVICEIRVIDGDSVPFFTLPNIYCYPPLKFKNKKEENFYWRTVRDVKRVLPLVAHVRKVIEKTNAELMAMPDKKARDEYMKRFEKRIYAENEEEFKKLTLSQGKLLIKLIDRETNTTSYELIKAYRGSFRAGFWQLFAKILGGDLKAEFGSKGEDRIIERVIMLVQAGQL
jgi:DNA-binding cell septation regulator SpoVG